MRAIWAAAVSIVLFAALCSAADSNVARTFSVTITQTSIRINGVELRSGPKGGNGHTISLNAAKKVFGAPQDTYMAGLGVSVYAWPGAGIRLQRGFRGSDKGKIFKSQVFFDDTSYKNEDRRFGKFSGHVYLTGLDITAETQFDSIRGELEKAGFVITKHPDVISATKGDISIFTVGTTNKIERIEAWCR
ncbi:MAG: hypothetical protein ABL994_12975 [Verrucomicrobiales bacterium]